MKLLPAFVIFVICAVCLPMVHAAPEVHAKTVTPIFNISGKWICDGDVDHPAEYEQHGAHVTGVYENPGYIHTVTGTFIDDHTLIAVQTRRNRADGSVTRMSLAYVFDSPDHVRIFWVALDGNSDLAQGQSGVGTIQRKGTSAPPAPPPTVEPNS